MPYIISPETVANGLKIATGQHTTIAASDSIVTGLRQVVSVVASLESNPADAALLVSAAPGTDGAITVKTWKTDGADPTPAAATTFSKLVNWIAVGY